MVAGSGAASFLIANATLVTMQPLAGRAAPPAAIDEADLGIVKAGSLVVAGGVVVAAGRHAECADALRSARASADFVEHDAAGALVMPGFVDAHTHALFAGNRVPDFEDLARGRKPALGMAHTIAQTRRCTQHDLEQIGERHLRLMREHGTTTAEVKSGYSLTKDGETRLLAALKTLDEREDLPHVVPTFCGAHALPPEFTSYDAFVDELCETMLPLVASQGVARFADAFCEQGFFTPPQAERFLRACAQRGLRLRIHADELHRSGGAGVAARLHTASADHLNFIDDNDVAQLAAAGCVAVLCPGTVEYLGLERYAPARDLIAAGVPVALATDFNPGTCPSFSLQTIAYLGRRHMRLSAAETIAALTVQPARSLGIAGRAGSLAPGVAADAIVLAIRDYHELGYYFGTNLVTQTFIGTKATA